MSEDLNENALIIFIKNPQLGKVKTRIAKDVGDDKALDIYLQLLDYTRSISEEVDATRLLYYSDWIAHDDQWDHNNFTKRVQHSGDLGERMKSAFQEAFTNHSKVIIIGSDCTELTAKRLAEAFHTLDHSDVVIGPTLDGGYYLLGVKSYHESLFTDIPWSSGRELKVTYSKAVSLGLTTVLLPQLADIDYYEDWLRSGPKED